MKTQANPDWFDGNQDAINLFDMLIDLAHTWDDLVDKDKDVAEAKINNAFMICLVYLPMNPFYQLIQRDVMPLWITVVSAYKTANHYEKNKDAHGIEIAHGLRYAAGNIIAYAVHVCVGPEKAAEYLPEIWKALVIERFDDYRKEHINA